MIEDFLLRAGLGGIGLTLATGPLGCFLIWRRLAYFGAALSHSALLGVALGFVLGINETVAVGSLCLAIALLSVWLEDRGRLPSDTILAVLAHSALAFGIIATATLTSMRVDLMAYLFGDVLAVGMDDLATVYGVAALVGVAIIAFWRPLLATTVDEELARVEGVPTRAMRAGLMVMIALVIAVGMKIVGLLLIVSLLILPAAVARRLSRTPETMALLSIAVGVASVVIGLWGAVELDLPAGPMIVAAATVLFALVYPWRWRRAPLRAE